MEPATTQEQQLTFPKRPQRSKNFKAREIALISNHFSVTLAPNQPSIYLYDIKIYDAGTEEEIPADARKLKRLIFKAANDPQKAKPQLMTDVFGKTCWASGMVLWSTNNVTTLKTIKTEAEGKKYNLVFTRAKEVNLRSDTFQNNQTAASTLQYMNVIIKRYFRQKNYVEWGLNSKFYDPEHSHNISEFYLSVYTGFKTSCEIYQHYTPKILIDFASRIVRTDSALYYIKQMQSTQAVQEMLVGRSVIASYGNYRMWRVDSVDFRSNPTAKFKVDEKSKEETTFVDYYAKKYNITIQDLTQPLLVNIDRRTGRETILIPELVQMTGMDDEMRANFACMKEVANYTRLEPQQRMQKVRKEVSELSKFCKDQYKIDMVQQSAVKGHVLTPPELTLGSNSFVPDRGNYQLRDPIFKPADFNKWLFVYADACRQDANYFLETLGKCSGAYAIKVGKPISFEVKSKKPDDLKEAIRNKLTPDTQIVVCMYPTAAKKHWYKALKDVCTKEKGIPCQAIVNSSLKKNAMSVCSKILLQMNAKIGMELWVTQKPSALPEKTMIIGADVYHNTRYGNELKSCIGFCASLNPQFSKFFSKVSFQNRVGEEIMTSIGKLVKEAVLKYFAYNGQKFLPECIIFFRDGLADNQLNLALEVETKSILNQLKAIDANYNPKFAEIVVTKRIDDRIFATEGPQRGGRGGREDKDIFNPPAGTVVAETIVSNNFDYLLVSQNVTQGTCTPTRFNVIYDTTGLPQDVFWQLSYWQSYNYFNWNGSVRVPAPVQYAHKLAYLVGQTVQGDPDKKLDQSLYYL